MCSDPFTQSSHCLLPLECALSESSSGQPRLISTPFVIIFQHISTRPDLRRKYPCCRDANITFHSILIMSHLLPFQPNINTSCRENTVQCAIGPTHVAILCVHNQKTPHHGHMHHVSGNLKLTSLLDRFPASLKKRVGWRLALDLVELQNTCK